MGTAPRRLHQASGTAHYRELPGYIIGACTTHPPATVNADRNDDLLVTALDNVIFLLDTSGEAPVDFTCQTSMVASMSNSQWSMRARCPR